MKRNCFRSLCQQTPSRCFQVASDDEGLKEEELSVTTEAGKDEEDKDKAEEVFPLTGRI